MRKLVKILGIFFLILVAGTQINAQQWSLFSGRTLHSGYDPLDVTWRYSVDDKFFIGDFIGNGNDHMLIINSPRSALFRLDWEDPTGYRINRIWRGDDNWIGGWNFRESDTYVVGDFNGDGKDELLCVSHEVDWAGIIVYYDNTFVTAWSNRGINTIGSWAINAGDRYISGDFSGRGRDELLCLAQNGWAMLLYFNGSQWIYVWSNGGNNIIGGVNVNGQANRFLSGRYRQSEKDELLTIAGETWTTVLRYNPSRVDWDWTWSQYGAVQFAGWPLPLNANDIIVPGNFDIRNNYDELLFVRDGNRFATGLPARLIGVNSERDFVSYWYNNSNNFIMSGYPIAQDRNYFNKARYNGRDYLFRIFMRGSSNVVGVSIHAIQFNNAVSESEERSGIQTSRLTKETPCKVYPNPAGDFVSLERYSAENECIYQVYNLLGVLLYEDRIPAGQLCQSLNTSDYKPGAYIIKIRDGNKFYSEKLIIQ